MRTLITSLFVAAGFIGAFFAGRLSTGHPGDTLVTLPLEVRRPAEAGAPVTDTADDGRISLAIEPDGTLAGTLLIEQEGELVIELADRYPGVARLVVEQDVADGAPLTIARVELPRPLTGAFSIALEPNSYRLLLLTPDDTLLDEALLSITSAEGP